MEDDQNYSYGIASFSTWKLGVVDESILSMNAVYRRTVHDHKYAWQTNCSLNVFAVGCERNPSGQHIWKRQNLFRSFYGNLDVTLMLSSLQFLGRARRNALGGSVIKLDDSHYFELQSF